MSRITSAHDRISARGGRVTAAIGGESSGLIGGAPATGRMLSRQVAETACRGLASTGRAIGSGCGRRPIASCLPCESTTILSTVPGLSYGSVTASSGRL